MPKQIAFMDVPGSDPNATMKGDIPGHVKGSTRPGSSIKRPKPVQRPKQYHLKKGKR